MITEFKIFETIQNSKIFNIKGNDIEIPLERNKISEVSDIHLLDLSYQELVSSGIWLYLTKFQRAQAIGPSYNLVQRYIGGFSISMAEKRIMTELRQTCVGSEILCWDDKVGTFGGTKPTVTEGKEYFILEYNPKNEKFKIVNDGGKIIYIQAKRFCKTELNIHIDKYNL